MGKTPQFTKVFVVGILLFFGFYILLSGSDFFGGFGGSPSYRWVPSTRNQTTEPQITAPSGEFVGTKEVEDLRHITLSLKPFKVSYITERKSFIELESVDIRSGLLSTTDYTRTFELTEDDLNKLSTATLSGKIEGTNMYGKLLIGLNGQPIYSNFLSPGESFDVDVDNSFFLQQNNFLVTAESSGWRLWAPTVYLVKNLVLKSDFTGEVSQSFDFHLKEEETPVNLVRIILKFDEISGSGNLIVRLNGNTVFNDVPGLVQWIDIEGNVTEGKNTIEMVSDKDTEFTVSSAEVIVFWTRQASEELEVEVSLSASQYNRLPGEIKFKVEKVFGNPTSLVATIENPSGEKHSIAVQGILEEGKTITVNLPKNYAGVGKNRVIFSVTGSGGYTLSDFRVSV